MARKRRSGKSKSEKEAEPKEKAGFLEELLKWICNGPFPINGAGLVLRRIRPPWDKGALAIVLIVIGILIVHPLFSPIWDFSVWLYYRVIPGPQIQVNFNNLTKEDITIGKEFKFWISEYQNDNNPIYGIRTIPDGANPICMKTNKQISLRLGRKREIHRLYNGSGYLRLCFDINEECKKEVENHCSAVILEGLTVLIADPNEWTSVPIALWFSEMEERESNKDYLQNHVSEFMDIIKDGLDFFEILDCKPSETNSNLTVLNIKIGCYGAKDNGENELRLEIVEDGGREDIDKIRESYEDSEKFESEEFVKQISNRIQKNILDIYPLRGKINHLQKILSPEKEPQRREMTIDIGYSHGVRQSDIFDILSRDQDKSSAKAKITYTTEQVSTATFISNEIINKEEYYVKWKSHVDEKN